MTSDERVYRRAPRPVRVGEVTITALPDGHRFVDASGLFDKTDEEWRPRQGHLEAGRRLRMDYGGYLVRTPRHVVVVDPGVGPAGAVQRGRFHASLQAAGVSGEEVSHVLFTHAHLDHVNGAVLEGRPAFPNAVHLCDGAELDFVRASDLRHGDHDIHRREEVRGVLDVLGDRLEPWERNSTIVPAVEVTWTPGHTPGSSVVVIASGDERALLLGDLAHCPVELVDPDWAMIHDVDLDLARRSRRRIVGELEGGRALAAAAHFPGLRFGRLQGRGPDRTWVVEP